MDSKLLKLIAIIVLLSSVIICYAQIKSEPNIPTTPKTKSPTERVPISDKSTEQIEAELAKEYYKDCVKNLQWALGIIVVLVIVIIGFVIVKGSKEHRETLADAKEALREARAASDKARDYEEKAQEKLSSIDNEVTSKLKEIEEKGKALVTELIKESEKQRETSREEAKKERRANELWKKGFRAVESHDFESAVNYFAKFVDIRSEDYAAYCNWGAALVDLAQRRKRPEQEKLLGKALEKTKKAIEINPDNSISYINWANSLITLAELKEDAEAEKLIEQALEKIKKALEIEPESYDAYDNWALALLCLAKRRSDDERTKLIDESKEMSLKAESIKTGSSAYNLARMSALIGDENDCQKWLKIGEQTGTLPERSYAISDPDFKSVCDKDWFKQICWPLKTKYL